MLCPERTKNAKAFTSVAGPGVPCCAQNDVNRIKVYTSVSALKRPTLRPEQNKKRLGVYKCLGPQEAHVVPRNRIGRKAMVQVHLDLPKPEGRQLVTGHHCKFPE